MTALFDQQRQAPEKDLKGVIVLVDDQIVSEQYFNGDDADTLHDIRSATKSVTSLLAGIAIDRKLIHNVDQRLSELLPSVNSPDKSAVRLRDLLTMRSGLAANDDQPGLPGNEDRLDESQDWMSFALHVPMKSVTGKDYAYASLNAFLVGAIVEKAAGMGLQEFAAGSLFSPLGITRYEWRRGPKGEGVGQGNLKLRLQDVAKIGQLVLHHGEFGKKRIVSGGWVQASLSSLVPISNVDRYADYYGYMWYTKTFPVGNGSVIVHFASGNGGNKIYVVPAYRMVVAITSSAYGKGYGQARSQQILEWVLASTKTDK